MMAGRSIKPLDAEHLNAEHLNKEHAIMPARRRSKTHSKMPLAESALTITVSKGSPVRFCDVHVSGLGHR